MGLRRDRRASVGAGHRHGAHTLTVTAPADATATVDVRVDLEARDGSGTVLLVKDGLVVGEQPIGGLTSVDFPDVPLTPGRHHFRATLRSPAGFTSSRPLVHTYSWGVPLALRWVCPDRRLCREPGGRACVRRRLHLEHDPHGQWDVHQEGRLRSRAGRELRQGHGGKRREHVQDHGGERYFYTAYGIHGTNQPWVIGTMASHGCIRMYNKDVLELWPQVPFGTMVITRQ